MYVPFEELSEDSRIWVYKADREINARELDLLSTSLTSFLGQWKAHGKELKSSFKIIYKHFVVIGVDEKYNVASGCSIDESVHFLQQLEQNLHLDLFDRKQVPFLLNDSVKLVEFKKLQNEVINGLVAADTLTFNPTINLKKDLKQAWLQPTGSSWLKRYLK